MELGLCFPQSDRVLVCFEGEETPTLEFVCPLGDRDYREIRRYLETYPAGYGSEEDDEQAKEIAARLPGWGRVGVVLPCGGKRRRCCACLFVVSCPGRTGFLDPRSDPMAVKDAIDPLGRVQVEFLRRRTLDGLVQRLEELGQEAIAIIHFNRRTCPVKQFGSATKFRDWETSFRKSGTRGRRSRIKWSSNGKTYRGSGIKWSS